MRHVKKQVNIGIGFVTGRKNFLDILKTYIYKWDKPGSIAEGEDCSLHLFIAYDLEYKNTTPEDYNVLDEEVKQVTESISYLGKNEFKEEVGELVGKGVLTAKEAGCIFSQSYAGKRNMVLYKALKENMDYLIFLDDDEYPAAVLKNGDSIMWMGQDVLSTHMEYLPHCSITHGHHCGYISPIPVFQFDGDMTERVFKTFIEIISNDIVTWESIKSKMENGGVQYAERLILESETSHEVKEEMGMKFISGSNLGINLKEKDKLFAFYNPPNARGEDTFLSTCLGDCNIQKVPCYTFHDGFSLYKELSFGVLPEKLEAVSKGSLEIENRFYHAALGWIRYKPLLLYITQRKVYRRQIKWMRSELVKILPQICSYFKNDNFKQVLYELDYYSEHVAVHSKEFEAVKTSWKKILNHI